jgi:predicted nucleic acid-binding protein
MLVDTNVLVDILQNDPVWADWSVAQLQSQAKVHRLVINPINYSELSLAFGTVEALDKTLLAMELSMIDIPKPALFLAGKAFVQRRRSEGVKGNVLGNFLSEPMLLSAVPRPALALETQAPANHSASLGYKTPDI